MSSSESDEIVVGVDGRSADTTARAKRSHSSGGTAMDNFRIPTSPDGTLTAPGAQQLFHKARLGEWSILGHHLTTEEKSQIRPGDCFIFDATLVARWTDNRSWSKSYSTKAGWLIYKEMEVTPSKQRVRKANGLNKKIISDTGADSNLRLVCYYEGEGIVEGRGTAEVPFEAITRPAKHALDRSSRHTSDPDDANDGTDDETPADSAYRHRPKKRPRSKRAAAHAAGTVWNDGFHSLDRAVQDEEEHGRRGNKYSEPISQGLPPPPPPPQRVPPGYEVYQQPHEYYPEAPPPQSAYYTGEYPPPPHSPPPYHQQHRPLHAPHDAAPTHGGYYYSAYPPHQASSPPIDYHYPPSPSRPPPPPHPHHPYSYSSYSPHVPNSYPYPPPPPYDSPHHLMPDVPPPTDYPY